VNEAKKSDVIDCCCCGKKEKTWLINFVSFFGFEKRPVLACRVYKSLCTCIFFFMETKDIVLLVPAAAPSVR
jgi:hypothetical protein